MYYSPVIFPIAASACSSCLAAVRLANVSGTLVPRATIDTPLAAVLRPITQPRREASYKHKQDIQVYKTVKTKRALSDIYW